MSDVPDSRVTFSGQTWERENYDTDAYQWVRPMDDSEYDWDADDVSFVGRSEPSRIVSLSYHDYDEEWDVSAAETMGPTGGRPGYTDVISSQYQRRFDNIDDAVDKVVDFLRELS